MMYHNNFKKDSDELNSDRPYITYSNKQLSNKLITEVNCDRQRQNNNGAQNPTYR